MCALCQVDGHHPLQAVATGTAEKQGGIYRSIVHQGIAQAIDTAQASAIVPLVYVVKVKANQSAMGQQGIIAPAGELSTESGIVEMTGFEALHIPLSDFFFLQQTAEALQFLSRLTIIIAADDVVDLMQLHRFVGHHVADGSQEKTEAIHLLPPFPLSVAGLFSCLPSALSLYIT